VSTFSSEHVFAKERYREKDGGDEEGTEEMKPLCSFDAIRKTHN